MILLLHLHICLKCISMEKNLHKPNNDCLISAHLWHVHTISPPYMLGGQPSVSNFEKGPLAWSEKKECLGGLKEFLPYIFTSVGGGHTMFHVKKDFIKRNMAFRAKFLNVDLGQFLEKKHFFNFLVLLNRTLNHLDNKTTNYDVELLQLRAKFELWWCCVPKEN